MNVSELWDKHKGHTIYIVGTGPSLRVFPLDYLKGQVTIGLNQAWRHFMPLYSITIHPELVTAEAKTRWIVKGRKSVDVLRNPVPRFELDHPEHYVFVNTHDDKLPSAWKNAGRLSLYQGGGVQTTAIHCALRMGARAIILVGVDMCSLDDEHHGHAQHVRWCGKSPEEAYAEYREHTRMARAECRRRGVPLLTLSPFVGVGHAEEDYQSLKKELGLLDLPKPVDVSLPNEGKECPS